MADKLIFEMEINAKMDEALEQVGEINEGTKEINENLSAIKQSSKVATTGIKAISNGFKGLGLAMKSAGIGLVIEAFNFLKEIMMKNQRVVDGLEIAMNTLSIVFNEVASVITDFGETILGVFTKPQESLDKLQQKFDDFKTYIKEKFSGVGTILSGIMNGSFSEITQGFSELGDGIGEIADDVVDTLEVVAEKATNAFDQSVAITKLKNEVKLLEAEQVKLNFTYLKEQEIQRQIRDDVSLTIEERMEANKKLGDSLTAQLEDEKAIVMEKLRLAKMESDANKENVDLLAEVIMKEAELADLEERITGFRSEQMVNEVALLQEQKDAEQEILDAANDKELERLKKVADAKKAADKQAEKDAKAEAKRQADLEKLKIDLQKKGYSMAKGLFSENEKVQKAFALGEIAVDTARAISSLTANSEANPGNAVTFGGAGIAQFIAGMLRIATNIKSAKNLLSSKTASVPSAPSSDSGSGSSPRPQTQSSVPQSSVPSFDLAGSTDMFVNQPVQAYVIQQDVQDQTELNQQIQNRATL